MCGRGAGRIGQARPGHSLVVVVVGEAWNGWMDEVGFVLVVVCWAVWRLLMRRTRHEKRYMIPTI